MMWVTLHTPLKHKPENRRPDRFKHVFEDLKI